MSNVSELYGMDIEVFPDFHSFTAISVLDGKEHVFVLHEGTGRDDRAAYLSFLKRNQIWITFNGIHYDYPVVHNILTNKSFFMSAPLSAVTKAIYTWSTEIITGVQPRLYESRHLIPQFDLFKIWHFDNKARSASLKHIEFYLRWHDLRDMPIDPTKPVGNDPAVVRDILDYNRNDVLATLKFWEFTESEGHIDLRKKILNQYGINVNNTNDVSIGSELLAKFLSDDMGIPVNDLKKLRTIRKQVHIKDCIPPINFQSDAFKGVQSIFNSTVVRSTKNAFKNLSCTFANMHLKFGLGGLHGAIEPGLYVSDDVYSIVDIDVASYYPNLAINYGYKPEHLGNSFGYIYRWMFQERTKIPKADPINKALKLSLNGSFGRMGSSDSFLFDLKAMLSITVTGQLLLSKLIEDIVYALSESTLLQVNTDGATFKVRRDEIDKLKQVCGAWEQQTKLVLEYATYDRMAIRDVNNYCALSGNHIKAKGDFETEKEAHKNLSKRVVSIAATMHLLADTPIDDVIMDRLSDIDYANFLVNKKPLKRYDIHDYCYEVRAKGGGNKGKARLYEENAITGKRHKLQKINRYYISKSNKCKIIKVYDDGSEQQVMATPGITTKVINKIVPGEDYLGDLNYNFYVQEARKLVESVKGTAQLSLF